MSYELFILSYQVNTDRHLEKWACQKKILVIKIFESSFFSMFSDILRLFYYKQRLRRKSCSILKVVFYTSDSTALFKAVETRVWTTAHYTRSKRDRVENREEEGLRREPTAFFQKQKSCRHSCLHMPVPGRGYYFTE